MPAIHAAHIAPQPLLQEIGGQMYHVSVLMVEPSKRDIKVSPSTSSFETDLGSSNLSGTLVALQDISISMTILLVPRLFMQYRLHQNPVHLTDHQDSLDEPQNRMLYFRLLSARL
jgi:hypothetical protein